MIHSSSIPLVPPPDSLSIPQFLFDAFNPLRPERSKSHTWLIEDKGPRSYSGDTCQSRANALANVLYHKYGLRNDHVACIFSPNNIDYPIAIWACLRIGAIVSGANPSYTTDELVYQMETVKAHLLFTHIDSLTTALAAADKVGLSTSQIILLHGPSPHDMNLPTVEQLVSEGLTMSLLYKEYRFKKGEGKSKIAFLSFSSGTTGRPKAVAIPHAAVIANVLQMSAFSRVNEDYAPRAKRRFRPGDKVIGVLPLYHIYGLVVNLHFILFCGMVVVVVPKFNFEEMLKTIAQYRITHLMLVPPQVVLLCKHPASQKYDLSSLRYVMVGAAPLSTELTYEFRKLFPHVRMGQGYGMTETSTTVLMNPVSLEDGIPGSAGRLVSGAMAKIVKENGKLAKFNEPGELWVYSPSNALCYANNDAATKETFIDGWVRTGDEVMVDKEGNFYVTDRIKEIFKVKGFQVAPAELEGHILQHPDVSDCAVISIPDQYSGEVPLAYVTLHERIAKRVVDDVNAERLLKESIAKHVSDAKVRYKWLDGGIEFIDAIPKNPSGKLLRRVLRDKAKEIIARRSESRELIKVKL